MFTQIVKFKSGEYGIRRWSLFGGFEYKDLKTYGHWWGFNSGYMHDCKAPFEDVIRLMDKGKPLSRKEVRDARLMNALKG